MKRELLIVLPMLVILLGLPVAWAQVDQPDEAIEVPEDKQATVLTPLTIGNTWVYENTADGILSTDRVEGMVLFEGQPWYLVRTIETFINEPDEQPMVTELWLTHLKGIEADALVEVDEESLNLKLSNVNHFLRYPVAAGDTYRTNPEDPSIKVEVVAVDQELKTKAGTFKCIVYRETSEDEEGYSFTAYVAPGVGIVRYVSDDDGEVSTTDLIKFSLVEEDK